MKLSQITIAALSIAFIGAASATCKPTDPCGGGVKPPVATPGTTVNNGVGIGNSNTSHNTNTNRNTAKSAARAESRSKAIALSNSQGGAGGAGGKASQGQEQGQGQSQDLNNAGNASVQVTGDTYQQRRIPVATAFAAGLVASYGTCLGSASGGVQGAAIGLSFGTTTMDQGCHLIRRMNALVVMGMPQAALTLACIEDDAMYTAIRTAGYYCAESDRPAAVDYPVPVAYVPAATVIPRGARNDRN